MELILWVFTILVRFEEIFKNSDDRYDREIELKPQKPEVKQSPPRNDTKNEAYIFNNHNGYHDDQGYSNHIDYNQNRYNKMEQSKQINHHPEESSLEQLSGDLIGQGDPWVPSFLLWVFLVRLTVSFPRIFSFCSLKFQYEVLCWRFFFWMYCDLIWRPFPYLLQYCNI